MKIKSILLASAVLLGGTSAIAGDIAIGAKVSTLGAGLELTTNVVPMVLNARVLVSGFTNTKTFSDTDATYDAKLKLFSVGAIADWYPFAGKFRVSGGLFYNGNKFTMTGKPAGGGSFTFNNVVYTTANVGTVSGEVKFNSIAPYIGIGFGDAVSSGSPLGFNVEVGALYQGAPKSSLTTTSSIPGLAANLAAEKRQLDDSLSNFKWYPVIAIGMTYKF